jgi:hypothetical protein
MCQNSRAFADLPMAKGKGVHKHDFMLNDAGVSCLGFQQGVFGVPFRFDTTGNDI